jgi:hypothetical protein
LWVLPEKEKKRAKGKRKKNIIGGDDIEVFILLLWIIVG